MGNNTCKIIVLYRSKYGSAKRYAEWIAEDVGADLYDATNIKPEELMKYDTVVFGGSLYAVGILGISLIKDNYEKIKDKRVIVFSVGASPAYTEAVNAVKNSNFTDEMKKRIYFFHLRGGFSYNNLNFVDKILMSLLKLKIMIKKPEKRTKDEKGMLASYSKPADWTNKKTIAPIINCIRGKSTI